MTRTSMAILIALFTVACDGGKQVDDILALTGDPANGEQVYADNCASCHGGDATGGSGPNLLEEVGGDEEGEDAELVDVILGGEDEMPPFIDVLTDQEIADVLAWLHEQAG